MRTCLLTLLWFLVLAACAPTPPSVPSPSHPSPVSPSPTMPAARSETLSVQVLPDAEKSYRAVAGRVPFTVTLDAKISGGVAPFAIKWDWNQGGQAQEITHSVVFTRAGEYTATVTVQDNAGQTASATQRFVAYGAPPLPIWKYGITAHLERRRAGYYPTLEDVKRASELARAAGIQVLRIDFNWDLLNPAAGQWTFDDYDAMVRLVRAQGLDILAIVDYSSWWASSAQDSNDWRVRLYSAPRSDDFARYTHALVTHFKQDIHAWEIWNEPNTAQFWKPKPNAARYAELLQEAYAAVKYADPRAVVVFGGVSGNGIDGDPPSGLASNFIADAYAAGAKNYFDVLAIHPYLLPNSGIATVRAKIAATQAVLKQNGDEKIPLWVTEIGAPSNAPWWPTAPIQTEDGVAAWLEQVYTHLWDQTPAIFWYDLQDQGTEDTAEGRFGLLRVDFSRKPAYEMYRGVASR